ncbi:hypothetical protein ACFQ1S_31570 [Kibdelosporangium lantanae]|uniref:ATP-grasp-modified RiPP n=1 Tax=Kibdelosporangium lantanae TaxID=1497396 RepID=A0ABW3MKH6_9PSEU
MPSEHEDHARRRAEGDPTPEPPTPPEPAPQVIQVYRPSQDQIVTYPAGPTPPPTETNRPEGQDRGADDADPN